MPITITYVTREDIYGICKNTPKDQLELKDFLINADTLGVANSIVFIDKNNGSKTLR